MIEEPLFPILIANYNNGKYLMDAIESVRQQTYANWEIVLLDEEVLRHEKAVRATKAYRLRRVLLEPLRRIRKING